MDTYEMLLNEEDGITYVSLVDYPAVEVGWQCYGKGKKPVMFSVTEERVITGVVMIPEKLIYRRDGDYEYQVYYSRETVRRMCENMLKNNGYKYVDLNHNNETVGNKVTPLEVFLKDSAKGITPKGFDDMPDGTLFCSYHINDDDLWEKCKDGTFNGFSLEGLFTPKQVQDKELYNNNMLEKFKETLKRILATFGRIETKEGVIAYNEEELSKGVEVYDPETGEPTADGEYHTETSVIVITDGKVADIIEEKEEEPVEDETVMEEPVEEEEPVVEEPETDSDIEGIKSEIETIKTEIAEIKSLIEGLKDTEKEPIEEEFERNRKKFSGVDGSKLVETLKNIKKTTNNKY